MPTWTLRQRLKACHRARRRLQRRAAEFAAACCNLCGADEPPEEPKMMPDRKIIVKGSAKQYKLRPGLTGHERLRQRLTRLHLDAARVARRGGTPADATLADELGELVGRLNRTL